MTGNISNQSSSYVKRCFRQSILLRG